MPKTKIQSIVFTAMRVFCMFMFPDSTFTANIFCRSICTSDVQKYIPKVDDSINLIHAKKIYLENLYNSAPILSLQ